MPGIHKRRGINYDMPQFRFRKSHRLKSRKRIGLLFQDGKSLFKYPVKLIWRMEFDEEKAGVQVAFSVPKKKFKRAVARNRVKRQLREVWRLQKPGLETQLISQGIRLDVLLIFVADEEVSYSRLERAGKKLIRQLQEKVNNETSAEQPPKA